MTWVCFPLLCWAFCELLQSGNEHLWILGNTVRLFFPPLCVRVSVLCSRACSFCNSCGFCVEFSGCLSEFLVFLVFHHSVLVPCFYALPCLLALLFSVFHSALFNFQEFFVFSKCSLTYSLLLCFLDVVSFHRVLRVVVFLVVMRWGLSLHLFLLSWFLISSLFCGRGFPQMLVISGCLLMVEGQKIKTLIGLSMCRFAYWFWASARVIQAGCLLGGLLAFRVFRSFLLNWSFPQRLYFWSSAWRARPGCWCSESWEGERGGRGRGFQASEWCWLHPCPVTWSPETLCFTVSRESASEECWGQGGAMAPSIWRGRGSSPEPFGLGPSVSLPEAPVQLPTLEPVRMQACMSGWFSASTFACFPLPKPVTTILSYPEPDLCYCLLFFSSYCLLYLQKNCFALILVGFWDRVR